MAKAISNNSNIKPQITAGNSWPREIAFAMIAIGTGIGAGVILKNKEVTDDPKSLGIAGGVTIATYGILKLLFRRQQDESPSPILAIPQAASKETDQSENHAVLKQEEVENASNEQEKPNPCVDQEQNNLPNSNSTKIDAPSEQITHEQEEVENASNEQEKPNPCVDQEQNSLSNSNPTKIDVASEQIIHEQEKVEKTDTADEIIDFASLVEGENDNTYTTESKEVTFAELPKEPIKSILKKSDHPPTDMEESNTDANLSNTSFDSDISGYFTSDGEDTYDTKDGDISSNSLIVELGEEED